MKTKCKRCKKNYWERKDGKFPALSRRDNKTWICESCGTAEAMFDFKMSNYEKALKKEIQKERNWLQ